MWLFPSLCSSTGSRHVLQLFSVKKHKSAFNTATIEGREEIGTDYESLEF
jgi:hypothetical protein